MSFLGQGTLFQVVGLPRSGTAFLSAMFNLSPTCIAYHELAADGPGWSDALVRARTRWDHVADCTTYGFLPKAVVSDSIKVFIDQPTADSYAASQKAFGFSADRVAFDKLAILAAVWCDQWHPLVVQYADLFTGDALRRIWNHCFARSNETFPQAKADLLLKLNIQRMHPETVFGPDILRGREAEFV